MYWPHVTRLIRRHYSVSQNWPRTSLRNWVLWAASKNFLFTCYDSPQNKKLLGLVIARPVSMAQSKEIGNRPDDKHEPDGPIIYVDLLISNASKPVLQALLSGMISAFGRRSLIAFFRFGRTQTPKIYSFTQFRKTLLGDNYEQGQ